MATPRFADIFPELRSHISPDAPVGAIECHSDRCGKRNSDGRLTVFFAIKGPKSDGHDYVMEAIGRGADVAVVELPQLGRFPPDTPLIAVANSRRLWAMAQKRLHGSPDDGLAIFVATGTDGKTTCAYALQHLIGKSCGRITSIDRQLGHDFSPMPSAATTPNCSDFYSFLAAASAAGTRSIAMEMSSHALAQERLWGANIDGALFTNLSLDHCDFHGTMESYFSAKAQLFDGSGGHHPNRCALCCDGQWGRKILQLASANCKNVQSYGQSIDCDWRLGDWLPSTGGGMVKIIANGEMAEVELMALGKFNAINLLGAAALLGDHIPWQTLLERMATFITPPGRLEPVQIKKKAAAFVDYAHTPMGLQSAIGALREHFSEKFLVAVFGCGGDRDRSKRSPMAAAAETADFAIVTADNPRSERVEDICKEICSGFKRNNHGVIFDRKKAIREGLAMAAVHGGVLLVAGKGHEKVQIIGDEAVPFDDVAAILEAADGL